MTATILRNYDVTDFFKSSKTKDWTYNMTPQCNQMNKRLSIVDHSNKAAGIAC